MSRICITGSNGMLGKDLLAHFCDQGWTARGTSRPVGDITSAAGREAAAGDSDVIINCAAFTNVDGAESQVAEARAVNAEAVGALGELARREGIHVIQVSTDFVFDGEQSAPYTEDVAPRPLGTYGLTKWEGEQALASSGCSYAVARVQWTYGAHGANFISKVLDRAHSGQDLRVVDDQVGTPTPTTLVAELIEGMARERLTGTYHLAANGYASRFEVAQFVIATCGMDVDVSACQSSDFVTPAQRPLNSCFDCTKLDKALGVHRGHWQEYLTTYLERQI